jgi:hypothetical protein
MSRDILTRASCKVLLAWYEAASSEKNSKEGGSGGAGGCSAFFRWVFVPGAAAIASPFRFISITWDVERAGLEVGERGTHSHTGEKHVVV